MSENPAPPPLDTAILERVIDDAITAHINARHPDLTGLRWVQMDGEVFGFHSDGRKTPAELTDLADQWAQRLELDRVPAYFTGEVEYAGVVDGFGRVTVRITVDRDALVADLAARKAAREAGEQ